MNAQFDVFERQVLFGLRFVDAPSVGAVTNVLLTLEPTVADHDSVSVPVLITPNVDQLVKRDRGHDSVAAGIADRAQFVLADGQPIVWASRLLGRPLQTRLAGSSLTADLWPRLVSTRRRVLVIAGSPSTAEKVDAEGPTFEAIVAPMLDLSMSGEFDSFVESCLRRALAIEAEFVFVTLGYPKQCNVIDRMIRRWPDDRPVPLFLAVGASFDMYYGAVRRAPSWMQRYGLEWLFRFGQEPRRLFKRYFVDDPAFGPMVVREWKSRRKRGDVSIHS